MAEARRASGRGNPVSLPMYDWPEVRPAMDALWSGLRGALARHGFLPPAVLDRRDDYKAVWHEPRMLLSQTCGYPYWFQLRDAVQVVATPCYAAPGCAGPSYRSFVLVRRDSPYRRTTDLRGGVAIANAEDSQSGYATFRSLVAPLADNGRFFRQVKFSGSHRASYRAVAAGEADACATDAVCVALARRHEKHVIGRLRILAPTPAAPALPFVTAIARSADEVRRLRSALDEIMREPKLADARAALFLDGIAVLDANAYARIGAMAAGADRLGYRRLA